MTESDRSFRSVEVVGHATCERVLLSEVANWNFNSASKIYDVNRATLTRRPGSITIKRACTCMHLHVCTLCEDMGPMDGEHVGQSTKTHLT